MKLYKLILIFKLINLLNGKDIKIPKSPCENVFDYVKENSEWFGRIKILNTNIGSNSDLLVVLSSKVALPNPSYYGKISLFKDMSQVANDVNKMKPVDYKVKFPISNPLPQILEIKSNGKRICHDSESDTLVTVRLTYSIFVPRQKTNSLNGIPGSSNSPTPPSYQNNDDNNNNNNNNQYNERTDEQNVPSATTSQICGTTALSQPLIHGGSSIRPGAWPWLIAMFEKTTKSYTCAGSLISTDAIVTVAHCIITPGKTYGSQDLLIGVGKFNINNWNEPGAVLSNLKRIITHPDFNKKSGSYDADVAVLILETKIRYNQNIRPVCLWEGSSNLQNVVDKSGTVVGWGSTENGKEQTTEPRIVQAKIVSDSVCLRSHEVFSLVTSERTFCAGLRNGKGPCTGDSGSGLMIEQNGKWYLRGAVSGSVWDFKKICNLNQFVIYSDVAKFRDWIKLYATI